MSRFEARPAAAADRPVVARLIQLYLHDMNAFNPFPIGRDGLYAYDLLDRFWQHPYLLFAGDELAGFALVIEECPVTGRRPCWFIAELFVLRPWRRQGLATSACMSLFAAHRGLWHVAVIEKNETAASYWRRLFDSYEVGRSRHDFDGERWLVYEYDSQGPR